MALGSCTTHRGPCVNFSINIPEEQEKLTGARFDTGSNEAPTPPKAPTPPIILPPVEDFFTKFMKVFMETTQAQAPAEPRKRPLKARTPEIY